MDSYYSFPTPYTFNYSMTNYIEVNNVYMGDPGKRRRMNVRKPSTCMMVADGLKQLDMRSSTTTLRDLYNSVPGAWPLTASYLIMVRRHSNGYNFCFADGHMAWQNHTTTDDFTPR